jgi:uncharacterized repeat protein (TIGR01451 family)
MRRTVHVLAGLGLMMNALVALVVSPAAPAAAQVPGRTKPIEITVTKVRCATDCRNDGLESDGESAADFYGIIRVNGVAERTRRAAEDQELVEVVWPALGGVWIESFDVPRSMTSVPVSIEIWDHDSSSGDDLGDASPASGRAALEFTYDTLTGALSGDITSPAACATGNGEPGGGFLGADPKPPVEVCVAVNADRDGDGLFDSWESGGIDVDHDDTIDLALNQPPYNADPFRKDLFVESDFMADATHSHAPPAGALQDVVDAFAAAPVTTPFGGMIKPGIALHAMLDEQIPEVASFLFDSTGPLANDDFNDFKLGSPTNPCDGRFGTAADRSAPNCAKILAAKALVFRYSIFGHAHTESPGSSGRSELDARGGNDFIVTNGALSAATIASAGGQRAADASTYMHELGHTLSLRHGGFEDVNCKPNYRSVMNYTLQFANNDPNRPLDYSATPLASLEEDGTTKAGLDENKGIGGPAGQLAIYGTPVGGNLTTDPADGPLDWDNDGAIEPKVSADVNFINTIGPAPMNGGCNGATPNQKLDGYDDWNHIVYSFRDSRYFADGAMPVELTELTEDVLRMMNTGTDLKVAVSDAPDPVAAGTDLTYSVTVSNLGAKPATAVEVIDTLPAGLTYRTSSAACTDAGGVVTCALGNVPAGETRTFTVTAGVPASMVYDNGGPKQVTNRVEVRSPESPDPVAENNTATETTTVIAVADARIAGATATAPLEMLVGASAPASVAVTVENAGPSSPVDTVVTTSATSGDGVVANVATATSEVPALAAGSPRTVTSALTIACRTAGASTVTVESQVSLKNAADVDPDLTNNRRSVSFQVDCVVPIAINVRPGGSPNSINLNTDATLAALTTRAGEYGLPVDFDATTIDAATVLWGLRANLLNVATPAGAREMHGKGHLERSYELDERTVDADTDMVLHFKPSDSGLTSATTEGCLKGKFRGADGRTYTFFGCDSVRVVPAR